MSLFAEPRSGLRCAVAASLVAAVAGGCSPVPQTEIVVVVSTDLARGTVLRSVQVIAQRSGASTPLHDRTYRLEGARYPLPGEVVLVANDPEDSRPVTVRVVGELDGRTLQQDAVVQFRQERTLYLQMTLSGDCVGRTCGAGQTCRVGACVAPEQAPVTEVAPTNLLRHDAAADVADDAVDAAMSNDQGAVDVPADVPMDAGMDAGADVPMDIGMDVPMDTGVDVPMDVPMAMDAPGVMDVAVTDVAVTDVAVTDVAVTDVAVTDVAVVDVAVVDVAVTDVAVTDVAVTDVAVTDAEAGVVDVPIDVTCSAGETVCSGVCANLSNDPSHCGRCTTSCGTTAGGRPLCFGGVCDIACDPGFRPSATEGCEPTVRMIAPMSGAVVSGMPMLRWSGAGTSYVRVCADRACASVQSGTSVSTDAGTTHTYRPTGLAPGWHFWQVGASATSLSPIVWQFFVGSTTGSGAITGYAPDFNGDGFGDLVVATELLGGGAGSALLTYFGAPSGFASAPSQSFSLSAINCSNVHSMRQAGDLDGDGFPDMFLRCGSIWVMYGAPGGLMAPRWVPGFGNAVGAAGDVDGDGYGDVAVYNTLAYRIYYGRPMRSPSATAASTLLQLPAEVPALIGDIRGGLDVNGDGAPDVALGASGVPAASGMACGRVYVFVGGAGRPVMFDSPTVLSASSAADAGAGCSYFGVAVALMDTDGDGAAEVAVGEPYWGPASRGRVHLFSGVTSGSPVAQVLDGRGALTGAFLLAPGDINGDGAADLLATHETPDEVFVYFNDDLRTRVPSGILSGPTGTQFSYLPSVGDIQGDGQVDIAALFYPSNITTATPFPGVLRVYRVGAGNAITTRQDLAPPAGQYFSRVLQ